MTREDSSRGIEVFRPVVGRNPAEAPRETGNALGVFAVVIAALLGIVDVCAVAAAIDDDPGRATTLAILVIISTTITFLMGFVALVLGRGRWWGILAMFLSVVVNPWTLMQLLAFFGGLVAA